MPANRKLTMAEVVAKLPADISGRYDFSRAVYAGAAVPITNIVCPEHGPFSQYSGALRKGTGCPTCGHNLRGQNRRKSKGQFAEEVRQQSGGKYEVDVTTYKGLHRVVRAVCADHGPFAVKAMRLLYRSQGCSGCEKEKRATAARLNVTRGAASKAKVANNRNRFLARAKGVHGDAYSYDMDTYTKHRAKMRVTCKAHGDFWMTPEHILKGSGCARCSHHASAGENALTEFLRDELGEKVDTRNRKVICPKELDIFLPEHGLAIEYCGEYWHGSSTLEGDAEFVNRHRQKYELCQEEGIRLLTVFESEWLARSRQIKALLRRVLGHEKDRVYARRTSVSRISNASASAFFDLHHVQGGNGAGVNYALQYDGCPVAVMRFGMGSNDRGRGATHKQWTITRYATSRRVVGGASKLFSAFLRDYNPDKVKSFSDNRYFSGGMYAQMGFVFDGEHGVDYKVWHARLGLLHKSRFQRREIPNRIRDIGSDEQFDPKTDKRTEKEMTYLLGCRRIYDCGKKRWVWTRP